MRTTQDEIISNLYDGVNSLLSGTDHWKGPVADAVVTQGNSAALVWVSMGKGGRHGGQRPATVDSPTNATREESYLVKAEAIGEAGGSDNTAIAAARNNAYGVLEVVEGYLRNDGVPNTLGVRTADIEDVTLAQTKDGSTRIATVGVDIRVTARIA